MVTYCCKKDDKLLRFIDHLKSENVVSSPLVDLDKRFEVVEEEWRGNDMDLVSIDNASYWAMTTEMPVLHWDGTQKPKNMRVFKEGVEMEYASYPQIGSPSWSWRRYEKEIEPFLYKRYKKGGYRIGRNSIILSKDEYFISGDIFFPSGEYSIEVEAKSGAPRKYRPYMAIYLDNVLIDEVPAATKNLNFISKMSKGMHRIKIGFRKTEKLNTYDDIEKLILRKISIKMNADLILIPLLSENKRGYKGETFKAFYKGHSRKPVLYPGEITASKEKETTLILNNNEYMETAIDLESDYNTFEVIAYSHGEGAFLLLWIDDKEIGRKWILPLERKSYFFSARTEKGKHKLKFRFIKFEQKNIQNKPTLFIHRIIIHPSSMTSFLRLHEIKNQNDLDEYSPDKNPFSIKAKLKSNKYALNALLAPPRSELQFNVNIPVSGALEFGYGILSEDDKKDEIKFSVLVEHNKQITSLFSKILHTEQSKRNREIPVENIDLTAYQKEKIKLTFLTESVDHDKNGFDDSDIRPDIISFWFNPVIYKRENEVTDRSIKKDINVILISIDTLRADHLGCYGYRRDTSPNTDKLSEDGVLFINNFCHSPSTLPSHLSMLSSLYPSRHLIASQKVGIVQKLNPSIPLLSDLLREENYFTGAFTGGGYVSEKFGFSHGFDFYYEDANTIQRPDSAWELYKQTFNWIEKNKDKKFFLFLHTYQVHSPYSCPEPYNVMYADKNARWKSADMIELLTREGKFEKFKKFSMDEMQNLISLYDGGIRYMDEYFIKPLIETLKTLNLYNDTMIIFTSDHGEEFYEHGGWTHDHTLYNELIRVPLIIKFPGSKFKGMKIKEVSRIIDIMPTVLESLGIHFSAKDFDGSSLIKSIDGGMKQENLSLGFNYFYFTKPDKTLKVRLMNISMCNDSHKLILNDEYPDWHHLFRDPASFPFPVDKTELFDFTQDPLERNNLENKLIKVKNVLIESIRPYYQKAKKLEIEFKPGALADENLREKLRALGYIN